MKAKPDLRRESDGFQSYSGYGLLKKGKLDELAYKYLLDKGAIRG